MGYLFFEGCVNAMLLYKSLQKGYPSNGEDVGEGEGGDDLTCRKFAQEHA